MDVASQVMGERVRVRAHQRPGRPGRLGKPYGVQGQTASRAGIASDKVTRRTGGAGRLLEAVGDGSPR